MEKGVKLGYGKLSKTGNDIDKLKELKKQNSKFKRNTKDLNKKVTQEKDDNEGDDNAEPEDAGNKF